MSRSPVAIALGKEVATQPAPIHAEWIISGTPEARAATLSQSADKDAVTVLWECTAGVFRWHFDADETVYIVGGAVTISSDGMRHTLSAGDSCYFPAGTSSTWIVHSHVRKIAFIRVPAPAPVNLAMRAMRAIWRRLSANTRGRKTGGLLNPQPQG